MMEKVKVDDIWYQPKVVKSLELSFSRITYQSETGTNAEDPLWVVATKKQNPNWFRKIFDSSEENGD